MIQQKVVSKVVNEATIKSTFYSKISSIIPVELTIKSYFTFAFPNIQEAMYLPQSINPTSKQRCPLSYFHRPTFFILPRKPSSDGRSGSTTVRDPSPSCKKKVKLKKRILPFFCDLTSGQFLFHATSLEKPLSSLGKRWTDGVISTDLSCARYDMTAMAGPDKNWGRLSNF